MISFMKKLNKILINVNKVNLRQKLTAITTVKLASPNTSTVMEGPVNLRFINVGKFISH